MDDGTVVAEYKELSVAEKRALTHIEGLRNIDAASYIALSFLSNKDSITTNDKPAMLVIHESPLKVELYTPEGDLQVSLNERSLLHYETSTTGSEQGGDASAQHQEGEVKDRHGGKEVIDYGEDGT